MVLNKLIKAKKVCSRTVVYRLFSLTVISLFLGSISVHAQDNFYQQDSPVEWSMRSASTLLISANTGKIQNSRQWKHRREAILAYFQNKVFGTVGFTPDSFYTTQSEAPVAMFNGKAWRSQTTLVLCHNGLEKSIHLLIYRPNSTQLTPFIVSPNTLGNHAISVDPDIFLTNAWMPNAPYLGIINHQVTEQSRGADQENWPIKLILKSGFGLVTFYYGDIAEDRTLSSKYDSLNFWNNSKSHSSLNFGKIAEWSWGVSRIIDYMQSQKYIDRNKIYLKGVGLMGIVSAYTAASDYRIAGCWIKNSFCNEDIHFKALPDYEFTSISSENRYWFAKAFRIGFIDGSTFPVDNSFLLSLVCPRPLYYNTVFDKVNKAKADASVDQLQTELNRLYSINHSSHRKSKNLNVDCISDINGFRLINKNEVSSTLWNGFFDWIGCVSSRKN